MPFIHVIPDSEISDEVRAMYERQRSFWGFVPNYARVFCWRPEIMALWAQLQAGIKRHMDKRRFELVTFVAASALRSTLCSLAHGRALAAFIPKQDVQAIAQGETPPSLSEAEAVMVEFSRKVARGAFTIGADDVEALKEHGFTDAEIFDIVATVGARAFWTDVVESLGVEAEPPLAALDGEFRAALTVGRAVATPVNAQAM